MEFAMQVKDCFLRMHDSVLRWHWVNTHDLCVVRTKSCSKNCLCPLVTFDTKLSKWSWKLQHWLLSQGLQWNAFSAKPAVDSYVSAHEKNHTVWLLIVGLTLDGLQGKMDSSILTNLYLSPITQRSMQDSIIKV